MPPRRVTDLPERRRGRDLLSLDAFSRGGAGHRAPSGAPTGELPRPPRREGRETRYRPTPGPLGDAIGWMTGVGAEWDDRLAALQRHAARRAR